MTSNIFLEYGKNPLELFQQWLSEAEKTELNDPNAMALATVDKDGKPQVRMVLLKEADERGFTFHTNKQSSKGSSLQKNPSAGLNFYWKSLRKQVRVSGHVENVSTAESDAYFATRSRESRIGAWASKQSQPLADYNELEKHVAELAKKFEGKDVPRPPHWGGYRVVPERIEFWIGHPDRLHKRFVYLKNGNEWNANWLFP